ncbi:MAG TPA: GNAT family N-acetyltransferase [Azospirillaceae bacterium]|nr:GNAT family N-acetyltransferase [Azospirillaceae bacterium]
MTPPRIVLRPFHHHERGLLLETLNRLEVAQWLLATPFPFTPADADAMVAASRSGLVEGVSRRQAIARAEDDAMVGCATVRLQEAGGAMVGYWLMPEETGCGYASAAVRAMLADLFGSLGRSRVEAFIDAENARSEAVLRRCGFRPVERYDRDTPNRRGRTAIVRFEVMQP